MNDSISANGSKGHHTFTLEIIETTDENSTSTNTSYISYTFKISASQYHWEGWGNNISYSVTIGDNTYYGTIPSYYGNATVLQSNTNIPIVHEADGTKTINIAFNVVDNANQYYTCGNASANKNVTLTPLHKQPFATATDYEETDPRMIALDLPNYVIVNHLSKTKFTPTFTYYDGATFVSYEATGYTNQLLATSTQSSFIVDASLHTDNVRTREESGLTFKDFFVHIDAIDSMNGKGGWTLLFDAIDYTKPVINKSTTSIKRKTSGGTSLIDSKVVLNLNSSYYTESTYVSATLRQTVANPVGTNNTITTRYKIWLASGSEPSSWTSLGTYATVSNFEISNVDYDKKYKYKIQVEDYYGNTDTVLGEIPTGVSVWSEYKDHVDFLKITAKDIILNGKDLKPTVLYNNTNGEAGTVTLSESASNFEYIEIFYFKYVGTDKYYSNVKVYDPEGKDVMLHSSWYGTDQGATTSALYFYREIASISGTSITRSEFGAITINTSGQAIAWVPGAMSIVRVVGYK